jgi:spore coat protein A, manganese oxidase
MPSLHSLISTVVGIWGIFTTNVPPEYARLLDPCKQPIFEAPVLNALDPAFRFVTGDNSVTILICKSTSHLAGLVDEDSAQPLTTSIYGYGDQNGGSCTWPGKTLEVEKNRAFKVRWENTLPKETYLLKNLEGVSIVDTNLHWAYSLPGYESFTIENDGVPTVTHLHGSLSDYEFDGNPEFFFSPGFTIKGPHWEEENYVYDNRQSAATLWYHDHTLGITRLNVHAGLIGFYIVRDNLDTGKADNALKLPAFPYEAAFAIQDRMFKKDGSLFYPSFPGDPFYEGFIEGEGAELPEAIFPSGGPTALAEFFGNFITVNGKIWPKMAVEPRNYRIRLVNACDSRFFVIQFAMINLDETDLSAYSPLPFTVVGADQGLATEATPMDTLVFEPGARIDIVFNFKDLNGTRVVMTNLGKDEPYGGEYDDNIDVAKTGPYCKTNRIMAFDVTEALDATVADAFDPALIDFPSAEPTSTTRIRKVALFEGKDEFGRLMPLLGTAEKATDADGNPILWPSTDAYVTAGLADVPMEGAIAWHSPTTENPKKGSTEEWEIWNVSADAHPVHLHGVFFEVVSRNEIVWDSETSEEDRQLEVGNAVGDGTYLVAQPLVQHNGALGQGYRIVNPTSGATVGKPRAHFEAAPKDMVIALPDQVTRIRATFRKKGRFVWHCHILSHEDHEMMRVLQVS